MGRGMKILLSNDDGIWAPGIKLLEEIASGFSDNIVVIAPDSNRSGASHALTLAQPFRAEKRKENHYAIGGSPSDCIAYGLRYLWNKKEEFPDVVLSGINSDSNVSEDIIYSGTVAAAREASLFGIPAIALSQQKQKDGSFNWDVAAKFGPILLKKFLSNLSAFPNLFININFPGIEVDKIKGIRVVSQGIRSITDRIIKEIDPRNQPYYWIGAGEYEYGEDIRDLDKDLGAINEGYITVVPLTWNSTDFDKIPSLKEFCNEQF